MRLLAGQLYVTLRSPRNKAVAEGAVSFYLQNIVAARIAKQTYGVKCNTPFNASNPEHLLRQYSVVKRPSGIVTVPHSFNVLLAKVSDRQVRMDL